jgi:hypothetical protein
VKTSHKPLHPAPDDIVESIAMKWRQRGFPHYALTMNERMHDYEVFSKYDRSKMISNGIIKQTLHALGLVWHYFPHHWDVRVGSMRNAWDVWNDEELFAKAISSRIKWGGYTIDENGNADLTESNMRKALRTYSGVQRVSNFRPSAAAAIYDKYADGVVWDMSCGYGGRLLGAIASPNVSHYIGTEPATLTMEGLVSLAEDFAGQTKTLVSLVNSGSEDYVPTPQSVSLCFTSPPYFNTEIYSDEKTQSWKRYPTKETWNEYFLRKTLSNCYSCLKHDGNLVVNVANVKTHKTLEKDTVQIAEEEGFALSETLQLAMSSISKGGFKYEPVFVFKKKR